MKSKTTRTLQDLKDRMGAQGKRIDVLKASGDMPGTGTPAGYSTQVAALEGKHRAASADLVRLTSTPENEEDWERLHERLDRALTEMERDLERAEASGRKA